MLGHTFGQIEYFSFKARGAQTVRQVATITANMIRVIGIGLRVIDCFGLMRIETYPQESVGARS